MMIKQILSVAVASLVINTPVLAQSRNVISSCRLYTSAGLLESGRCTIRTHIDGNYIIVRVETPWGKDSQATLLRLANISSCSSWSYTDEVCSGALWYGEDNGWSYVWTGELEENGKTQFSYSLGTAHTVIYDGFFPRP